MNTCSRKKTKRYGWWTFKNDFTQICCSETYTDTSPKNFKSIVEKNAEQLHQYFIFLSMITGVFTIDTNFAETCKTPNINKTRQEMIEDMVTLSFQHVREGERERKRVKERLHQ